MMKSMFSELAALGKTKGENVSPSARWRALQLGADGTDGLPA